jgi:predicted enzyme related to lactoylglutathione lyase
MSASRHEVGHFEIPADNVDGLRSFYSLLFGWEFEKGETQGYYMVKNAGISGAFMQALEDMYCTVFRAHGRQFLILVVRHN